MRPSKLMLISIVLLMFLSLFGCSTITKQKTKSINYHYRIQSLNEKKQWKLQGRIGVIGEGQRGSANLLWSQNKDAYDMKIIAPIGTKKIMIKGNLEHISLKNSNGDNLQSNTPIQTIYENIGWYLPIDNLSYWVKGIPNKNQKFKWYSEENGKFAFWQLGWKISFSLPENTKSSCFPNIVIMENDKTKIKISINKWTTYPLENR